MFKPTGAVLGAALLTVAMWIWVQAIAVPHQQAESAAKDAPRGNLSDLYPRWLGARELLLHGRDPYGADITREIQIGYYGRVLDPRRPNDPRDQQAFAYPVYVVLMLAPTVHMDFPAVHRISFWFFAAITAGSVLLWLDAFVYRMSWWARVTWILFTLGCFPAIQGVKLQQLTVLVAALVAAAVWAIARRHFVLAGVLLAFATIKPQLVFLLMLWLCLWIVGNWRERQRLLWSFAATCGLLVIAGEMLLPGWIHEFRAAMAAYYRYTGGGSSVLDVVLTQLWGRIVTALLVSLLPVLGWRLRRAVERTEQFQWMLCFTLATTLLVIPMFAPYNQLLLLPAAMMFVRSGRSLWQRSRLSRFFIGIAALSTFWSYLAAVVLDITLLFLPGPTVQKAWGLPFYPSFAIPITIYAMLLGGRKTLAAADAVVNPPHVLRQIAASE